MQFGFKYNTKMRLYDLNRNNRLPEIINVIFVRIKLLNYIGRNPFIYSQSEINKYYFVSNMRFLIEEVSLRSKKKNTKIKRVETETTHFLICNL